MVEKFRAPRNVDDLVASLEKMSTAVALERVTPRVEEAIVTLIEKGVPYLDEAVAHFTSAEQLPQASS